MIEDRTNIDLRNLWINDKQRRLLKLIAWLMAVAVVTVIAAYWQVRPWVIQAKTPTAEVSFSANRRQVHVGSCMRLRWNVTPAQPVWLNGQSQNAVGEQSLCPQREGTFEVSLKVSSSTGAGKSYVLPIQSVQLEQDRWGGAVRMLLAFTLLGLIVILGELLITLLARGQKSPEVPGDFSKDAASPLKTYSFACGLILIAGLACLILQPLARLLPFDPDNVLTLSMAQEPPGHWWTGQTLSYLPVYRPIPFTLTWLQYQFMGLEPIGYFVVNALILISCGVALFGLLYPIIGRFICALAAAFLFLTDPRTMPSVYWIGERQSSLAGLLGLLALGWLWTRTHRPNKKSTGFFGQFLVPGLLLMGSILSKEYGLAFLLAVSVHAWLRRYTFWKRYVGVCFLIGALYVFIRVGTSTMSFKVYSEDMGFLFWTRQVTYSSLPFFERLAQYSYNIVATFVGTIVPVFFSGFGVLKAPSLQGSIQLLLLSPVLLCCWIALRTNPRLALAFFSLVIGNALLSFLLYRGRNHLIGLMGFYATAAVGMSWLLSRIRWRARAGIAWGMVLFLTGWQAMKYRTALAQTYVAPMNEVDPCLALRTKEVSMNTVEEIKRRFGLPNPACQGFPRGHETT